MSQHECHNVHTVHVGWSVCTCCSITACCCWSRAWSCWGESTCCWRICCICCGVITWGLIMATDTGTYTWTMMGKNKENEELNKFSGIVAWICWKCGNWWLER